MSNSHDHDDHDDRHDHDDRGCDDGERGNHVARISGDAAASLTEDSGRYIANGDLDVQDSDRGENHVRAISNKAGKFGTFSIDSDGEWTYKLDNGRAATQALDKGDKGVDSFVVLSADGSAQKTINITINGAAEKPQSDGGHVPVIGGNFIGSVKEDAPVNTASGALTLDGAVAGNGFTALTQAGTYGSFSLNANGTWTYSLDNSKMAVQALSDGQTVTESFVVQSKAVAGTGCTPGAPAASKTIVVTVAGANDAPVAANDSIHIFPAPGYGAVDINVLANDSDVDRGAQLTVVHLQAISARGAVVTLNSNGTVHYDPSRLVITDSVLDTFTYQDVDEHGAATNVATVTVELVGTLPPG